MSADRQTHWYCMADGPVVSAMLYNIKVIEVVTAARPVCTQVNVLETNIVLCYYSSHYHLSGGRIQRTNY